MAKIARKKGMEQHSIPIKKPVLISAQFKFPQLVKFKTAKRTLRTPKYAVRTFLLFYFSLLLLIVISINLPQFIANP